MVVARFYYISRLRSNLIDLGQLTKTGHKIIMDDDWLEVVEKSSQRLVMRVECEANRLYQGALKNFEPVCLLTKVTEDAWLWHGRLGHASFHTLKLLAEKSMVGGVATIAHPEEVCEACMAGKQTRMTFPKKA